MNGGPQARVSSPSGLSTLITSAPRSASVCPIVGPASTRASSTTRTPASAAVIAEGLVVDVAARCPLHHASHGPLPPLRRGGYGRRDCRRLSFPAAQRRGRGTAQSAVEGAAIPAPTLSPLEERLQAGLRASENQRVNVMRAFVGVDAFEVGQVAHDPVSDLDAVAAVHVARGSGDV